ncbi:hypothetical protein [Streptomyces gossypiisoli]|uniref:hypothetical protein n=1 Tax=Streptomyces gossypiisoli TaxID=2748864 RepID=UPI0015DAEED7|nr:hypothetical protein [Streptomyces gossypiisoli]
MNQEERIALITRGLPERERQATVRLAREQMEGRTGDLPRLPSSTRQTAPRPRTERQRLLDSGFTYTVRDLDRQEAAAEHRARRARAEKEIAYRKELHASLTRMFGADYADEYLR